MTSSLQHLLDNLAATLDREVAIDDLDFRLIAFTSHHGDVDEVRRAAILTRRGPDDARKWALRHGVAKSVRARRVPGNEALGMLPRVCVALRQEGRHYGYLWLIDPENSLRDDELRLAERTAEACAALLHRERIGVELRDARGRELVRDLLSEDADVRSAAAAELDNEGLLAAGPLTVHAVARVPEGSVSASLHDTVADALEGLPGSSWLALVRPDHGVVISAAGGSSGADPAARMADQGLLVGVGDPVRTPTEIQIGHRQARRALRLALVMPTLRPVARWSELGVYRLLTQLSVEDLDASELHPAVRTLFAEEPALAETLELFLDRAGDTRAVADALALHRATVYYRLDRIRSLTGLDLDDGEQRLVVHLSLKLLRVLQGAKGFASGGGSA